MRKEKLSKEVRQETLMLLINSGFRIDKSIVNYWLFKVFKVKLYPQQFDYYFIGTITINGKIVNHLNDKGKYVQSESIEECYDKLVVFAFEKINNSTK